MPPPANLVETPAVKPRALAKLNEAIEVITASVAFLEHHAHDIGDASSTYFNAVWTDAPSVSTESCEEEHIAERDTRLAQAKAIHKELQLLTNEISAEASEDLYTAFKHLHRHEDKLLQSMRLLVRTHATIDENTDTSRLESFCIGSIAYRYWPRRSWNRVVKVIVGSDSSPSKLARADHSTKVALLNRRDGAIRKTINKFTTAAAKIQHSGANRCAFL